MSDYSLVRKLDTLTKYVLIPWIDIKHHNQSVEEDIFRSVT